MTTLKYAVLLLFATSAVAAAPDLSSELRVVRTVNVRSSQWKSSQDQAAELRQKLDAVIPSLIPDPSDGADLIIEYEESVIGLTDAIQAKEWRATLFHLACQSPDFGEPASRIRRGKCENNLFVRVAMGKMSGTVAMDRSAVEDFAYVLRDAILGFAPATKAPVPAVPVPAVSAPARPLPVMTDGDLIITGGAEPITFEPSPSPQTAP
jgi:hypothetical protein